MDGFHNGSQVKALVPETFWSIDPNQSPVRVLQDYHGVNCLSGGLGFSGFNLDNQLVARLASPFLPSYRTKQPIACEVRVLFVFPV